MENAFEVLVVILSTVLGVFLVLGIILLVLCIKIARKVKSITEHVDHIAEKAESAADFVQHASGPMALGKLIVHVVDGFKNGFHKARKGDSDAEKEK